MSVKPTIVKPLAPSSAFETASSSTQLSFCWSTELSKGVTIGDLFAAMWIRSGVHKQRPKTLSRKQAEQWFLTGFDCYRYMGVVQCKEPKKEEQ